MGIVSRLLSQSAKRKDRETAFLCMCVNLLGTVSGKKPYCGRIACLSSQVSIKIVFTSAGPAAPLTEDSNLIPSLSWVCALEMETAPSLCNPLCACRQMSCQCYVSTTVTSAPEEVNSWH